MNLLRKYNIKWNSLTLAFLFPFAGMLFVMLISQYEPFGKYSMLYSDMYHQYYPFFVAFRDALRSGESLLHSWSVGLGMDYLGLIAYLGGEDIEKVWQSNIFGRSVYDLVQDGLNAKLIQMPADVRGKFRGTLTRIVNDGANGLICLIL